MRSDCIILFDEFRFVTGFRFVRDVTASDVGTCCPGVIIRNALAPAISLLAAARRTEPAIGARRLECLAATFVLALPGAARLCPLLPLGGKPSDSRASLAADHARALMLHV